MTPVILVVEDHQAMQRSMQLNLELAGYDAVTAMDGQEALDVLNERPVDLILADVAMPRMNGYQLYEALRREPRWALIPFIFVSARALDSDIRFGKGLGVDDYLIKPFDLEDLLAIVAGRLRRAKQLAEAIRGTATQTQAAAPEPTAGDTLTAGPVRINHEQHRVWVAGRLVALPPREFILLEHLAKHPDRAISLTELCQATHGLTTDEVEAGSLVYPLVRSLRRRLDIPAGDLGSIESVRGVGYRLITRDPV